MKQKTGQKKDYEEYGEQSHIHKGNDIDKK